MSFLGDDLLWPISVRMVQSMLMYSEPLVPKGGRQNNKDRRLSSGIRERISSG